MGEKLEWLMNHNFINVWDVLEYLRGKVWDRVYFYDVLASLVLMNWYDLNKPINEQSKTNINYIHWLVYTYFNS